MSDSERSHEKRAEINTPITDVNKSSRRQGANKEMQHDRSFHLNQMNGRMAFAACGVTTHAQKGPFYFSSRSRSYEVSFVYLQKPLLVKN